MPFANRIVEHAQILFLKYAWDAKVDFSLIKEIVSNAQQIVSLAILQTSINVSVVIQIISYQTQLVKVAIQTVWLVQAPINHQSVSVAEMDSI